MKYNKNIQNKVFQVVGIFPPILKKKYKTRNKRKRKGKYKESYIFIVYTIFKLVVDC